jgi:predicted GH43/DUF377 family glycosyl hydrolase
LKGVENYQEMVQRVFRISIPEYHFAYNPSIVAKDNGGYFLAFRHEPLSNRFGIPRSYIGMCELNAAFEPLGLASILETGNENSEDPRLFSAGGHLFVSHSHLVTFSPFICNIAVTQIEPNKKFKVMKHADLSYKGMNVEKNWIPFVYRNQEGFEEVYFIYKYSPHRILRLSQPFNGKVRVAFEHEYQSDKITRWEKRWGGIRGGTPAIRIGDEYLAFFHSSFISSGINYYIFGAITFDAEPPFRIKRISEAPIFFKGIYETEVTPRSWFYPRHHLRVMYPSGLVAGKEGGKDVFYVTCGENDVAIKCLVIDKAKLLNSLIKVN